jgi:hypothetical protein
MVDSKSVEKTGGSKVTVPKIYGAIAKIQAGVGNIPKDGIGPASQGSYKYVRNDDILEKISKLLIEHKVVVKPEIISHELITREIGANRSVALTVVTLRTTYISVEDGSEFAVVTTAEGADNGDKGGRKAVTQAQKIANLLTFSIATGEPDPDGVEVQPTVAKAESPAAKKIANAKGSDPAALFNQIKAFLGEHGLSGDVANAIGARVSGGKPASEWTADPAVLTEVLKNLKNGEVE